MNLVLYDNWFKKRLNKIQSIFGVDWFSNKKILELGCCDGLFGIELLKLGSQVVFADIDRDKLDNISNTIRYKSYNPSVIAIDQNKDYDLSQKFDLVLHLGVLYHLDNWRNDLQCALRHTDTMILETITVFEPDSASYAVPLDPMTDIEIETELRKLGCKFFRFDSAELNTQWSWFRTNVMVRHLYDWTEEKYKKGFYTVENPISGIQYNNHFRRMWLVLK